MVTGVQSEKGKALVLDQDQSGSSSDQSFKTNEGSSSFSYNHGNGSYNNFNEGYHNYGSCKGNNFRGKGKGRFEYNSAPRFSNGNPGILGTPKPYQSHWMDHLSEILTCQICNKKGHIATDCFHRHNNTSFSSPI